MTELQHNVACQSTAQMAVDIRYALAGFDEANPGRCFDAIDLAVATAKQKVYAAFDFVDSVED